MQITFEYGDLHPGRTQRNWDNFVELLRKIDGQLRVAQRSSTEPEIIEALVNIKINEENRLMARYGA